jgi:hypothetical protein
MRFSHVGTLLTIGLVTLIAGSAHARCNDSRVDSVRAQILAACPCNGNHGQYVSCVAHAIRDAVRNGDVDPNCKGAVTRCAARSTCGKKDGFVTCTICEPGTCTNGLCDDGVTACMDDAGCPAVVNKCSVKSTAERCEARGGLAGSGSCCNAVCVTGPTTTTATPPTTTPTTTTPTTTAAPPTTSPTTTTTTSTTLGSPSGAFVD